MAYTNLPPNLYDYFSTINQRIRKLESAPDQAMTTAVSAQGVSTQALTAANLANTQATTAIALANTKNTVFYSGTTPTANAINDQWIDTAHGNKLYIWNGSSWVSAQDSAISAAQSTANGKNAIYRQGTTPTTPYTGTSFVIGDMWFNTSADNAISTWNGTSWGSNALGNSAIYPNLSANKITSGTIDASVINVSNINAGNISTGTLSASRIATGSLNGNVITSNTITATQIAAGTITATQISSSYVYAGTISASNITTGTLSATVSLNAQSGTIAGWSISGTQLYASGSTYLDSSTGNIATTGAISSLGTITANNAFIAGGGYFSVTSGGVLNAGAAVNILNNFFNNPSNTTTSSANAFLNSSTGFLARSTSSQRYKVEILPEIIPLDSVMALTAKSWIDKAQYEDNQNSSIGLDRILGLIAEDVAQIPVLKDLLVNYNEQGQPDSVNYDRVAVALIPLLKDHETRLAKLEGANGTTTSN